jgi:glycosyltransferase involved in cell wall biosynthesis
MEKSLVSCIVPVFNGERYLKEALDSILGQTYQPLDIVVVNDGSTDGTEKVVESYGEKVRYVFQANAGPAAASNLGLSASQGEFIAFLAADDLWHREKIKRQMARFQQRPELDLCFTHLKNFWIPELKKEAEKFQNHRLATSMPGYTSVTLLAHRNLFEKVGNFNPDLQHGSDLDWFMRTADQGAIMELMPDVLVYRRLHKTNRSRRLAVNSRDTFLRILKASLDRRRRLNKESPSTYEFPTSKQNERRESD